MMDGSLVIQPLLLNLSRRLKFGWSPMACSLMAYEDLLKNGWAQHSISTCAPRIQAMDQSEIQ